MTESSSNYRSVDTLQTPLVSQEQSVPSKSSSFFAALTIENKGSAARDHMANERTFLAWLRTSLSLVTIGIGIVQLLTLKSEAKQIAQAAKPLGASFLLTGILVLALGFLRYFKVQNMLLSSFYPASQYSVLLTASIVFFLAMVTLSLAFAAR